MPKCPNADKGLFQAIVASDFPLDKFALLARLPENASACPLWRFIIARQSYLSPKPPTGRRLIHELKQTAIGPLHVRRWSRKAKKLGRRTLEAMTVAPRQIGRGIVVDGPTEPMTERRQLADRLESAPEEFASLKTSNLSGDAIRRCLPSWAHPFRAQRRDIRRYCPAW
jgi:hypothetical protein